MMGEILGCSRWNLGHGQLQQMVYSLGCLPPVEAGLHSCWEVKEEERRSLKEHRGEETKRTLKHGRWGVTKDKCKTSHSYSVSCVCSHFWCLEYEPAWKRGHWRCDCLRCGHTGEGLNPVRQASSYEEENAMLRCSYTRGRWHVMTGGRVSLRHLQGRNTENWRPPWQFKKMQRNIYQESLNAVKVPFSALKPLGLFFCFDVSGKLTS